MTTKPALKSTGPGGAERMIGNVKVGWIGGLSTRPFPIDRVNNGILFILLNNIIIKFEIYKSPS
jgi:hypothetical protein